MNVFPSSRVVLLEICMPALLCTSFPSNSGCFLSLLLRMALSLFRWIRFATYLDCGLANAPLVVVFDCVHYAGDMFSATPPGCLLTIRTRPFHTHSFEFFDLFSANSVFFLEIGAL